MIAKHKTSGALYEPQYIVHPAEYAPANQADVFACYRLSAYDGMPIGSLVWLSADELDFGTADLSRFERKGGR